MSAKAKDASGKLKKPESGEHDAADDDSDDDWVDSYRVVEVSVTRECLEARGLIGVPMQSEGMDAEVYLFREIRSKQLHRLNSTEIMKVVKWVYWEEFAAISLRAQAREKAMARVSQWLEVPP